MRRITISIIFAVMLLAGFTAGSSEALTYTVSEVTTGGQQGVGPQVTESGYILWTTSSWPNIYVNDGQTTTQLTSDNQSTYAYQIIQDNNNITETGQAVWYSHGDIQYYDGSSTIPLTTNMNSNRGPQINDSGEVVWFDNSGEIFLWNGVTTVQLTSNAIFDWYPQINNSGTVVWEGGKDIYLYDGVATTMISDAAYDNQMPEINDNGSALWLGSTGAGYQFLFFHDGAGGGNTILTSNMSDVYASMNNNDQVVWTESDGTDSEIFMWDGSSVIQITNNTIDDMTPEINDQGLVVWNGLSGMNYDIFLWDGSAITNLSNAGYYYDFAGGFPQISNSGKVVWSGNNKIYLATLDDLDNDGYGLAEDCSVEDPHDDDPTINPGAAEIKHDGQDQDCNGYDLTIDIVRAEYAAATDTLTVEATSALGQNAALVLEGYGEMRWHKNKEIWTITVEPAGGDPGLVTVTGLEGSESAATTGPSPGSEGNGNTCSDGVDNDGDGLVDCADPDCATNKSCR